MGQGRSSSRQERLGIRARRVGGRLELRVWDDGPEGAPADITILAPDLKVKIEAGKLRSRSKNTPFDGWELRGGVAATVVGGRTLFINQETRLSL